MSNRQGVEPASYCPPPWTGPWCAQCQAPVLRPGVCFTCAPADVKARRLAALAEKWTRHPLAPENLNHAGPDHHR